MTAREQEVQGDPDNAAYNEEGYWAGHGDAASGILAIARDTKRICLAWRSSEVSQCDCWGTIGGAVKDGKTPAESAKIELKEEVGYKGGIELHAAFVFQDGDFKYHNFVGIVDNEFPFQPGSDHAWETDRILWASYDNVIAEIEEHPEDFHPGLLQLFKNSRKLIESLVRGKEKQANLREPSAAQISTLQEMESRAGAGFKKWLNEYIGNDPDPSFDQVWANEGLRLDYFDDWLRDELGVDVQDDGSVMFYYLTPKVEQLIGDLPVLLYHHTSSHLVPKIRREGLRGDVTRSNPHENSGAGVYLTSEASGPAVDGYLRGATGRSKNGRDVSLLVRTHLRDLISDPDDADISSGKHQFILPYVAPSDIIFPKRERPAPKQQTHTQYALKSGYSWGPDISFSDLQVGDGLSVDGAGAEVVSVNPNGTVTLKEDKDGSTGEWGPQDFKHLRVLMARDKVVHKVKGSTAVTAAAENPYLKWIGVDLDGTFAEDIPGNDYSDPTLIGPPIPAMVEKIKRVLAEGATVKVFTARMADEENAERIAKAIGDYSEEHVGQRLEATNKKDPGMVALWDDKARRVERGTGKFAAADVRLMNDCYDSHGGETFCTLRAYKGENVVGYVDYSLYDDEIHIKMIEVDEAYQRQGIATALIDKLRKDNPGTPINWGMLTDDGAKLKAKVHRPEDDPKNRMLEQLEAARAEFVKSAQSTYDTYPVPEFGNLQGDGGLAELIAEDLEWSIAHNTSGWAQVQLEGDNYVLHCHDTRGGEATLSIPSNLFQEKNGDTWSKKEGVHFTPEMIRITAPGPPKTAKKVYHGTPHQFEAFSNEHVGKGEGADAYGWGLYFAENKDVAKEYSGAEGVGGAPVPTFYEIKGVRTTAGSPEQKAADLIMSAGLAGAKRLSREMLADAKRGDEWTKDKGLDYYQAVYDLAHTLSKPDVKRAKGQLIEANIPDETTMLDWDKPMSQQSPAIREALVDLGTPEETGETIYNRLAKEKGSKKAASLFLHSLGIKGIRYLDAHSRNRGHGTANFVIFDSNDVGYLHSKAAASSGNIESQEQSVPPTTADWKSSYKVKPPKKLYRGVATGQRDDGLTGTGVAQLGTGLYSSPSKSFAKMYGPVVEIPVEQGWPHNPLVLHNVAGGAPSVLIDWLLRDSGARNIREFHKEFGDDHAIYLKKKGYDGVIAGDEVVKFGPTPEDTSKTAGNDKTPPARIDTTYPESSNGWALHPDKREGDQVTVPLDKLIPNA